jgi:hypothetical protein
MSLPTKIRSISQPNWTDTLIWNILPSGRATADVDHDWRVSCAAVNGLDAVAWNKGTPFDRKYFTSIELALESLNYRPDA